MLKKVLLSIYWGLTLALVVWFLINSGWNWVLFIYVPLLIGMVISSYYAVIRKTKRGWIFHISLEAGSLLIALILTFFIQDIFSYDSSSWLPYLLESVLSLVAAVVFGLNLFISIDILLFQKKRIYLALVSILVQFIVALILLFYAIVA